VCVCVCVEQWWGDDLHWETEDLERFLPSAADFIHDVAELYVSDVNGKKLVSHGMRSVQHTLLVKNKLSCTACNNSR